MKNSEYVCGIPVPNNYNTKRLTGLNTRFKRHWQANSHILACTPNADGVKNDPGENEAINIEPTDEIKNKPEDPISLSEIEENETIKMEPTEGEISLFNFENKIDEKTRLKIPPGFLEYLETGVMKKHTWMEIIDGKLFCQVNLTSEF